MSPLLEQLHGFAAHLRDPETHPSPPGIEDRRLQVYRVLLFNNIRSLLSANFPVASKTLGQAQWDALAGDFLAHHHSRTPLFPEIAQEFLHYLGTRDTAQDDVPAWLAELAHYEWAELALQIAEDALPTHDPRGDLLEKIPVLSPLAWPLAYRWPVHTIGPRQVPDNAPPSPTLLLVRRDGEGEVRFSQLSPLVYRLLELIGANATQSGRDLLHQLAQEADAGEPGVFVRKGRNMLERLRSEGTLLGTR